MDWLAPLLLALFVALLYYPLLFTNRVLTGGDILLYFYPYRDYAAAALREWRLPLWNPYIFNGVPFLANPQAAVFYPLHWPLSWLPVTKQIYWSAALHTWMLGYGGYRLVRHNHQRPWAALLSALVLAGSGFYGGLIGHINQMNGAAWLPWGLLVIEDVHDQLQGLSARTANMRKRALVLARSAAYFALLVTLMLLAGHTQTTYINLFGIGLWLVCQPFLQLFYTRLGVGNLKRLGRWLLPPLTVYGVGVVLALLICAMQLLPTLELSDLGLRSGGLSYGEVSSFSLRPTQLLWTLIPTFGAVELGPIFGPGYTEFISYVGGLALVLAAIGAWQGRSSIRTMGLFFAGLGLFLALGRWNPVYYLFYKVVPGFDLFRVPARWMMLYTMGMALLAGVGLSCVLRWLRSRWMPRVLIASLVIAGVAVELLFAAQALPHAHPTSPQAVYGTRTAPAHLLTDPTREALAPAAMGRFLGMSTITYDPGDMADWQRVLRAEERPQLDQGAFNDFVIGLKIQELLVPNLPLFWRIPAVDGFDGGILPLQRYNQFLTMFIPPSELVPDGRLREQIQTIPSADLLGLVNAQYVITDKVRDLWFDNVYYDRQIGAALTTSQPTAIVEIPKAFEATHIDLIGYMGGDGSPLHEKELPEQNRTVATLRVYTATGALEPLPISGGGAPGADLTVPMLDNPTAQRSGAIVAFRDVEQGHQEYRVRIPLPSPTTPLSITVAHAPDAPPIMVQAMTLFDQRTQMFTPLLPSDQGSFRLVHSGDVKIYEMLNVRPRLYFVDQILSAETSAGALATLQTTPAIQDGTAAVVEGIDGSREFPTNAASTATATLVDYRPEQITVQTTATQPAFLVLSDSYYPGWQATIDGKPAPLYATNVLFRGLEIPAGEHEIIFTYWPTHFTLAIWLSITGLILLCGLFLLGRWTR